MPGLGRLQTHAKGWWQLSGCAGQLGGLGVAVQHWFEGRILGTQSGECYRHRDTFFCCNSRLVDVVSAGLSGDCDLLMATTTLNCTIDKRGKYSLFVQDLEFYG